MASESFVDVVAEQQKVSLSPEARRLVLDDVRQRMQTLVQTAVLLQQHSHRRTLTCGDLEAAFKVHNVKPLHTRSLNTGLTEQPGKPNHFKRRDVTLSLEAITRAYGGSNDTKYHPPPPVEPTFSLHWLAVRGRQPGIPQNPTRKQTGHGKRLTVHDLTDHNVLDYLAQRKGVPSKLMLPLRDHELSEEEQLLYLQVMSAVRGSDSQRLAVVLRYLDNARVALHQLTPYLVQLAADEVRSQCLPESTAEPTTIPQIKITPAGSQKGESKGRGDGEPVAPTDPSPSKIPSVRRLTHVVDLLAVITRSERMYAAPYLHQILPTLLSCLLTKRIGVPGGQGAWRVRERAAQALGSMVARYGPQGRMVTRVVRLLSNCLRDPSHALTSHYGALCGLFELGPSVFEEAVLPFLPEYVRMLEPIRHQSFLSGLGMGTVSESVKKRLALLGMKRLQLRQQEAENVYRCCVARISQLMRDGRHTLMGGVRHHTKKAPSKQEQHPEKKTEGTPDPKPVQGTLGAAARLYDWAIGYFGDDLDAFGATGDASTEPMGAYII